MGLDLKLLIFSVGVGAFVSVTSANEQEGDLKIGREITGIRSGLSEVQGKNSDVKLEIKRLERLLESKSSNYLHLAEKKQELEIRLGNIENNLSELNFKLGELKKKANESIRSLVVVGLTNERGNDDPSLILARQAIFRRAQKNLADLMAVGIDLRQIKREQMATREGLESVLNTEENLSALILDLEQKKKGLSLSINSKRVSPLKIASKLNSGEMEFIPPIKNYFKFEKSKKGVKLKFKGSQDILAPREGRIAFAGNLGAYGNVIIVDHGKETRSVILGDLSPTKKQGDLVKAGDEVGKASNLSENHGMIYFEVRKMNEVQNTIALMKRK